MRKFLFIPTLSLLFIVCLSACSKPSADREPVVPSEEVSNNLATGFEISYWIDLDLRANNGRGYWFHVSDRSADSLPSDSQIWGAASRCRFTYHALSLYVIYHRQFEIANAKTIFRYWKNKADSMGLSVVPVVVLEDYASPSAMNFTNTEITDFAGWCIDSLHAGEFGVYDIYGTRQGSSSAQNTQLSLIKTRIGDKIVRVGLQPGEALNANIHRAVQDTWSAECQGLTNSKWEYPVSYLGSTLYGRNLLVSWVDDRVANDSHIITWDLIPVAWDYTAPLDTNGYVFPGDNALTNDPPIAGRISLCHSYIVSRYPSGSLNAKFGGYSCDLHILQANSAGRSESPDFYNSIKADHAYTGYFSSGLLQVAGVYDLYDN